MPNKDHGFTLIELLITLMLLAVALAVAIPTFSSTIDAARQRTQINQLMTDLNFARSRAITTRRAVSVCAGNEGCNGLRNWSGQILVFDDVNGHGRVNEAPVRVSTIAARYEWTWRNFRKQGHMTFKPDGTTHSLNGTFILCRKRVAVKKIVINVTGRARLGTPTPKDLCI